MHAESVHDLEVRQLVQQRREGTLHGIAVENAESQIVDEIGYLPITRTGAMLFFQLMTRRYEHAATVLTSNKGFEEWGEIFGDDVMAAALIDRLVHHCHLVTIRGNSYRMRQHTELWQTLHNHQEPEAASNRRRRPRQEVATA